MKLLVLITSVIVLLCFCKGKSDLKSTTLRELNRKTFSASLSPNSKRLAVYSEEYVHLISLKNKNEDKIFKIKNIGPGEICFGGNTCWVGGGEYLRDGTLLSLDITSGAFRPLNPEKYSGIYALALSSMNNTLATGHAKGKIILWDSLSGKIKNAFGDYDAEIFVLRISADGKKLYSGDGLGKLKIWDLTTREKLTEIKVPNINSIFTINVSDNENRVIVGGGALGILTGNAPAVTNLIKLNDQAILSCDIRKKDNKILCGLTRGYVAFVNPDGSEPRFLKLHDADVIYVEFTNGGNNVISAGKNGTVKIVNLSDHK